MDIVIPEASNLTPQIDPARRDPSNLKKTWGFIDTTKVNADAFIGELTHAVRERHGVDSVVVRKAKPGVGLTPEQESELAAQCGVVVACFGD